MSDRVKIEKVEGKLLKEIVHLGCQEVSAKLSKMLKIPIEVNGAIMGLVPIAEIPMLTGNPEGMVTAARVVLSGEISGYMIFMLTSKSWDLCKKFLGPALSGPEMEPSAFSELANIACSSFITNIADKIQMAISFTPPEVMEDMTATILQDTLVNFSETPELLTVEITLSSERAHLTGFMFFIPGENAMRSLAVLFQKIKPSHRK